MRKLITGDTRMQMFILVVIYSIVLSWGYLSYLEPTWGYFGLEAAELGIELILLSVLISSLPVLFLPINIIRPSMFGVWILYLLTYIPMVVGAFYDKKIEYHDKYIISFTYLIGMYMLCFFYKVKLKVFTPTKLPAKHFWLIYISITSAMLLYIIFLYRDNLTFANIFSSDAVYELRFAGEEIQNQSALAGHFIMWLSNALLPFILGVGLIQKNKKFIAFGIIGLIIMYMTMANKQFLFAIIYIYMIYRLFTSKNPKKLKTFILYLLIPTALLIYLSSYEELPGVGYIVFIVSGIFLLRTVYTSTLMSVYYNVFFENHPHVYWSYVTGINKLIEYPYDKQLGIVVGTYFFNKDDRFNANANFFITDGLASFGLLGIPLIGIIASFVFYLFDSSASKSNFLLGVLLISTSCIALMNISLFTSLISGGLVFFIFLLNNNQLFKNN